MATQTRFAESVCYLMEVWVIFVIKSISIEIILSNYLHQSRKLLVITLTSVNNSLI